MRAGRLGCRAFLTVTVALAFGCPAFAQDAPPSPATPAGPASATDAGAEEIIVTAQRRKERLQDVGIALTAFTATQLSDLGVTNAVDIVSLVPGLKMNTFSTSAVVYNIRGVSQNDYGDQQEPPNAVYQDDSYSSTISLASFPTFDLERVEVLRGPQGTLFGRNATGGAIQYISKQPTDAFEGSAGFTVGSYGQVIGNAMVSGPLSDTVQFRLAGQSENGGNYLKAIEPGISDLGGTNNFAIRGILQWEPMDDLKAKFTFRYLNADHEPQAGMYSFQPVCPNANLQGAYLPAGATCQFYAPSARPNSIGSGYSNPAITPSLGGNPWETAYTSPSFVSRSVIGSTLRLDGSIDDLNFVSITDFQHAEKLYAEDTDASPDLGSVYNATDRLNQLAEEVRISEASGPHNWTIGAMGMLMDGHYTASYQSPFFSYLPTTSFTQKTISYAFFAQEEYALTPSVKLIGGLRYWNDERIGTYNAFEPVSGLDIGFSQQGISYALNGVKQSLAGLAIGRNAADENFSGLTAKAEVDYKPTNSVLAYLGFNRGSKSGGFEFSAGTPSPSSVIQFINNIPYKPETLNDYEAGVKTSFSDHTVLNIAAFYYDYEGYQGFVQSGPIQTIVNLNATAKGLEAELTTSPLTGLTITTNASLLDTEVKNVTLPTGRVVNQQLPQSPGFSGTLLVRYAMPVGDGSAYMQGQGVYTSQFCFTVLCAPDEVERAYGYGNIRIGYETERYDLAFFINNISNEQYRVFAADNALFDGYVDGIYAPPRWFGFSAEVRF